MIELKKPIKILLAEDNYLNQKLMYFNLSKMGFTLDIANDGKEALEKRKDCFYDIILMDIMMPEMDGFESTQMIRELETKSNQHSYIIGLTANVLDSDEARCLSSGMDFYLQKPFDIDEFCSILENLSFI